LSRLIEHAKNLGMPVQTVVAHLGPAMAGAPVGVPVDTAQRT
jgi:hypothetical protein